ncbi:MAG TPA: BatD family protein [bacterium]|nr:BatD family protein [bacterium]HPR87394.1 BatD family protein [bacterium]
MSRRRTVFIFISLLLAGAVHAQEQVTIDSKVDRAKILIGDVVRYSLRVSHVADVTVEMPAPGSNLGQFELRDYKVLPAQKAAGRTILGADYLISTFDTGEYEIPALSITYRLKGDTTRHILKSEPIKIQVQSLNPSEAGDIRDIKPPLVPPRDWKSILLKVLAALVLAAAAVALWWYLRRRRQGKGILPERQTPPRPAHEIALEALHALVASDWLAAGKHKAWHSELADILRRYIEGRYGIDALEMTSRELLGALDRYGLEESWRLRLQELLTLCDMAKFAKYIPEPAETEGLTASAFAFVEGTKLTWTEPEPQPQPEAAAEPPSTQGEGH